MSNPFIWHDSNGEWREQPSVIYPCLLGHYASTNFLNQAWGEGSGHPCTFRYTHCYLNIRAAITLYSSCYDTWLLQHTHEQRVWTCPQVRNLQFAPCWKRNMLATRHILLLPQEIETFRICTLHINTYLSCFMSNTDISKISVDFKYISLGGLLLFVNMWYLDLFFVYFLQRLKKWQSVFWFRHPCIPFLLFSCIF